jgi:hypothetical protein
MRARLAILTVLLVLLLSATPLTAQTLGAVLTGSQEVPARAVPGFGNATVTFDATRQNIFVTITVTNLGSPINNFHIHEQSLGVNGPVVIDLIGMGGTFANGVMTGTFAVTPAVAQRMLENPSNFYVNVHTQQFPGGAVRGQLAYVTGGPIPYAADLRGANEVPPVTTNAFGSAFVTVDPVNNTITWEVNTSGIVSPTLAHIHRGAAGVPGPVVIDFATSPAQIPNGRTTGTRSIATLSEADRINLVNAPGGFYVNVHSSAVQSGELRGQLVPANDYYVPVAGRVRNNLGQTFATDVRVFNPSYDTTATALVEYFTTGLLPNTIAPASMVLRIAPRATAALDDIATLLHVENTTGGLRISSAMPLAVTSRTFNDLRGAGGGTLGHFVAAQPRTNALRRGVMPHLSHGSSLTSGSRANVGFFNPNPHQSTVRVELRDAAGTLVGQNTIFLEALSQQQNGIATYFPGADLSNAANLTLSFDASAPVFAYVAVVDNISGAVSIVSAQSDTGVASSQ